MNELQYIIQIFITDIKVDDKYYNFKYHVVLNGQAHSSDWFSGDHSRRDDIEDFERELKDGWALEQVCQLLQFSY